MGLIWSHAVIYVRDQSVTQHFSALKGLHAGVEPRQVYYARRARQTQ